MAVDDAIEQVIALTCADVKPHGKRSLAEHLRNCARIASMMGMTDAIVLACAAHSVFGTSSYPVVTNDRESVARIIGPDAMRLVELFSKLPRNRKGWWFYERESGIEPNEWIALMAIEIINLAEQA